MSANVPYPAVTSVWSWSGISCHHGRPSNSSFTYAIWAEPVVSRWSCQPSENGQVKWFP